MKPIAVFDCEVFRDYFLVAFRNIETGKVLFLERTPTKDLNVGKLAMVLESASLVSFNGNSFDLPVIAMAMTGADNQRIKQVCDAVIGGGKPWAIYEQFGLDQVEVDHIDLIEVAPGFAGLKQYGGRMHAPTLADLPIAPDASISPEQYPVLRQYCANDLALTERLYRKLEPQINLRRSMTQQYGIDLRSKSDAQIAEAVIKHGVEEKSKRRIIREQMMPGAKLRYQAPDWIRMRSPACQAAYDLLTTSDYTIDGNGSPVMADDLEGATVVVGNSVYRLGIGGLHSSETCAAHIADDDTLLIDRDVASYYPSIILRCGLEPRNMVGHFLPIYQGIVDRRLAAKKAGDKLTADVLKIVVNGSFGKLGSKYSVLYAPDLMLQVTITGQLALLMLIEMLEENGIAVVSANTDGIVIKCPRSLEVEMNVIVEAWEVMTGLETEATEYAAIYSRDVNNYVAVKKDGKVKTKGIYADTGLAKSPANEICIDAVLEYLRRCKPVEQTIADCSDIRKFITLRQANGGATWRGQEIGKTLRWYYGLDNTDSIICANGQVARSQGAVPCQVLPESIPDDLDRGWYVREAESMLAALGAIPQDDVGMAQQLSLFEAVA